MLNNEKQDDLFLIQLSHKEIREFIYECADLISLVKNILKELDHLNRSHTMEKFKKPLKKALIILEGHIQRGVVLCFQSFKSNSS